MNEGKSERYLIQSLRSAHEDLIRELREANQDLVPRITELDIRVTYDRLNDILSFRFGNEAVFSTESIDNTFFFLTNKQLKIIGLEIHNAFELLRQNDRVHDLVRDGLVLQSDPEPGLPELKEHLGERVRELLLRPMTRANPSHPTMEE